MLLPVHFKFCHFNSIKVRLKPARQIHVQAGQRFQFHKGTIKTAEYGQAANDKSFQFHKGTIKTRVCLGVPRVYLHFNSIKVRLKL